MRHVEIRKARAALLEKSLLGYRKPTDGTLRSERTSEAKVGIDKSRGPDGRLVRTIDAKVGLPKIRA
jgi:hypothetical protein